MNVDGAFGVLMTGVMAAYVASFIRRPLMPRAEDAGNLVSVRGVLSPLHSCFVRFIPNAHSMIQHGQRNGGVFVTINYVLEYFYGKLYSTAIFSSMHWYCQMLTATMLGSLQSPGRHCVITAHALCVDLRGIKRHITCI